VRAGGLKDAAELGWSGERARGGKEEAVGCWAARAERREEGARAWAALAAELGRSGTWARLR